MSWIQCYTFLSNEQSVRCLGFVFGVSQVIGFNRRTIENPGTSFFHGGITGFVYGIGFEILGGFCTPYMRIGLNSMLIMGTGYKQFNNWRNPPPLTFNEPTIKISINSEDN